VFYLSRKKKTMLIALLAAAAVVSGAVILIVNESHSYNKPLKSNWGIELPKGCKILYEKSEDGGIFGDGDRYHVLSWTDGRGDEILWEAFDSKLMRGSYQRAGEIMDNLKVPAEQRPQPEEIDAYYIKSMYDDSMYMLLDRENKKLYLIERFI